MSAAVDQPHRRELPPAVVRAAGTVGWAVTAAMSYLGDVFLLGRQTVWHILRGEVTRREAFAAMLMCGVKGVPLVAITVCFSGMVFAVYGVAQFKRLGTTEVLGAIVAMSMLREVAPVLAATVVAARSGSAIAAEVSTMQITEQVEALRSLATSPVEFLAVPRYVALVLMLPLLTLVGDVAGVYGAGAACVVQGVSWRTFFNSIQQGVGLDFLVMGCVKAIIFGALIAVSSLRQGFRCGYGSAAVGRATTQAVVLNICWIHLANLLLAVATN
ncbi:MAG: ABC transporter permease [Armatimonadetes bacterium]|nr:ABC transporter permease [Armatimonadota bacterium]